MYLSTDMLCTIEEELICEGHWIFDAAPHAVQPGRLCMSIARNTLAKTFRVVHIYEHMYVLFISFTVIVLKSTTTIRISSHLYYHLVLVKLV